MNLTRSLTAAALAASVLTLLGCGTPGGQTLVKLERDAAETLDEDGIFTKAPREGMVALYGSSDFNPNVRHQVDEGDEVGFRAETEDGERRIIAVAGDNEQTINQGLVFDRTYYWKYQDEE